MEFTKELCLVTLPIMFELLLVIARNNGWCYNLRFTVSDFVHKLKKVERSGSKTVATRGVGLNQEETKTYGSGK